MSNPVINTKIEVLAEAIETLAIAVSASAISHGGSDAFAQVTDARKAMRDALSDFLQPTLRVVGGTAHQ